MQTRNKKEGKAQPKKAPKRKRTVVEADDGEGGAHKELFVANAPRFVVDLDLPADQRWNHVVAAYKGIYK